jgi:hypothetical protein
MHFHFSPTARSCARDHSSRSSHSPHTRAEEMTSSPCMRALMLALSVALVQSVSASENCGDVCLPLFRGSIDLTTGNGFLAAGDG